MSKEMSPNDFRNWRMKRGLSQHKAAQMLGYNHRSVICHFEKGTRKINPRVKQLCDLLDEKDERNDTLGQRA